jgi:elongator complex protein 3
MSSSILRALLLEHHTKLNKRTLGLYKRDWAKVLGQIPRDSDVLSAYRELVDSGVLPADPPLERLLTTRAIRTMSGVTPFAVMTKPYVCPGMCTFCPLELGMPKSYLSDEPAAARAKSLHFDPRLQIESRLTQLVDTGHDTDKIELIVIGGTFGNYPESYKRSFFKDMIDAVNGFVSDNLEAAQVANETAARRIVGISVETRPDWIDEAEVRLFRELGVTKVQVGVQAFDEAILARIKRGHSLDRVGEATRLLKNAGIKICYHYMPNLPGSTPEKDVEMARLMYTDPRFLPDFVKIYPAQVIPGTEMYREWERGEYQPYADELLKEVLKDICLLTPPFVRIDRLVRDISKKWVAAGTKATNMRQYVEEELRREGKYCQCIRCREARGKAIPTHLELIKREIKTLGGTEYLLTFESYKVPNLVKRGSEPLPTQHLYSLLRLRLTEPTETILFSELEGAAMIREVHTYGKTVPHDRKQSDKTQHRGLGKKLIHEAESIARHAGYQKIAVISSIGTRDYYRKQGYERAGYYMVKSLVDRCATVK